MLNARFFDGQSTRAVPCIISSRVNGELCIELQATPDKPAQGMTLAAHDWQANEPFAHTPRVLTLPSGHIEVDESPELQTWLTAQGKTMSWVERAQISWRKAGTAALLLLATLFAFYKWGLPVAASYAAAWIPESYVQRLNSETLAQIDRHFAQPSQLDVAAQARIKERFAALIAPAGTRTSAKQMHLLFRSSAMGPNALALPAGTVVLFDELVKLAPNDDAIMGVLAHEWGHVEKRHAMSGLIQSSAIGLFFSLYLGDASSVIATVGTGLGFLHYSRTRETESDTFAIATLKANQLSGADTAELFTRMMAWQPPDSKSKTKVNVPEFLSTHPATPERIERFKSVLPK
ncbi:MAG: M48 family metallopeptidase [Cytophagales bacterium]|nr:M48 family metallopeptidase [Cytophagales bacterium]